MNKILPLQSLRGILCMIVVLVHYTPYKELALHNHYLAGISVISFFILSGYVLTLNYSHKLKSFVSFISFIKKRFLRLYPLHLFFLIIFLLFEFNKYFLITFFDLKFNSQVFKENNFETLIQNLFLLNSLSKYLSYNIPSWAVSAEFISSFLFGLSILIFRSKLIFFSIAFFIFSWFIFTIQNFSFISYLGPKAIFSCLSSYYLGSLIFFFNQNRKKFFLNNFLLQFINFIILIFFIYTKTHTNIIIFNISILLLYLINIDKKFFFYNFLTNKYLIFLGTISYSIYLSHYFVYFFVTQIFRYILKLEKIDSYSNLEPDYFIYLTKLILCVAITIFLSKFTYNYIENKFRAKS